MRTVIAIFILLFIVQLSNFTQVNNKHFTDTLRFDINIPFPDIPFNTTNHVGGFNPSMSQALEITKSFCEITDDIINGYTDNVLIKRQKNKVIKRVTQVTSRCASNFILYTFPLGSLWLHEEFHRVILKNQHISSYNGVYDFELLSSGINVSHVTDVQLVNFKKNNPSEFVRMSSAGYEGQNELIEAIEKDNFFYTKRYLNDITLWANTIHNIVYLKECALPIADKLTDEFNKVEINVADRDFTGLDYTAWIYDLDRPNEPYEARGIHPSGVGIDRYIKYSDLNNDEKKYIKLSSDISFLSLLDPMLLGFRSFVLKKYLDGRVLRATVNIKHNLTSFGNSVNLNFFLQKSGFRFYGKILNQFNFNHYFPGIDLQLIDYPISISKLNLFVAPRGMLWLQPEGQQFRTSQASPGGLFSVKITYRINRYLRFFSEMAIKSAGFVAGNPYLVKDFSVRFGLGCWFFKK